MSAGFVRLPPDGAGKKLLTETYNISGEDIHVQKMQISSRNNYSNSLSIDDYGAALISFNEGQPSLDAFGNLRITEETVLGAYDNVTDSQDDLYTIVEISGGTQVYDSQKSLVSINVNGDAGAMSYRITNRYHHYLPGTGTHILLTIANGDAGKVGNERCWGYGDQNNGMSFVLSGTTLGVRLRSDASGSVVDNFIPQSEWNGDKVDGTGTSGYNLDITKRNLYWIGFAWLGVGAVRMGVFGENGERIICHTFINVNGDPYPYTRTATLPLSFSNYNTTTVGSGSELKFICAAVYSDSTPKYTFWRHTDMETLALKEITTNTPIISMRAKLTLDNGKPNRVNAYPETLNVFVSGGTAKIDYYAYLENTAFTGLTWNIVGGGIIEGDTTATSVDTTDSYKMITFYLDSGSHTLDLSQYFELNDEGILLGADSQQGVDSLVGTKLAGDNVSVFMTLSYRELY